jgi:hypothetical protein
MISPYAVYTSSRRELPLQTSNTNTILSNTNRQPHTRSLKVSTFLVSLFLACLCVSLSMWGYRQNCPPLAGIIAKRPLGLFSPPSAFNRLLTHSYASTHPLSCVSLFYPPSPLLFYSCVWECCISLIRFSLPVNPIGSYLRSPNGSKPDRLTDTIPMSPSLPPPFHIIRAVSSMKGPGIAVHSPPPSPVSLIQH